eukprot:TRINITY_DN9470_c0_g1_i5.p1 TRINITY_DN9470_c0_g1~~TRINITY_DN9470_c0_g1_i5.p1  ORF type:complete len:145 (-),score=14.49 TRINITY_DN9470_c0_g1_i5:503-937(-)
MLEDVIRDRLQHEEHLYRTKWIRRAIIVSWISIFLTSISAILGFIFSTGSSAMLSFSLESLVDVVTTAFVLWRFWGGDDMRDPARAITLENREKKASVLIAFTLMITAIIVGVQAIVHLASHTKPENARVLMCMLLAKFIEYCC